MNLIVSPLRGHPISYTIGCDAQFMPVKRVQWTYLGSAHTNRERAIAIHNPIIDPDLGRRAVEFVGMIRSSALGVESLGTTSLAASQGVSSRVLAGA